MFTGMTIEIPLGMDGVTGNRNPVTQLPSQALEENYISIEDGVLSKEGGQIPFTPAPLGAVILNGWDWWPTATVQRQVALLGDGSVRKDSGPGNFPITLVTGLNVTQPSQFMPAGAESAGRAKKLFVFTGTNAVQVLEGDGATMTAIDKPAADWTGTNQPLCGALHANRLWAAGNLSDPHRVYFSTVTDHEDLQDATNAGSIAVFPGEGDRITALWSYRGLLIVGKAPRGLYTIDTSGVTVTSFGVDVLSRGVGTASVNSIAQIDNDILFLDTALNVQSMAAVQALGDLSTETYGQWVDLAAFLTARLNPEQAPWARAVYYGLKREMHIAVSGTGSGTNNARLVVDFNGPSQARFRYSHAESCPALWLMRTTVNGPLHPMRGDTSGTVWHMDRETPSAEGVPGSAAELLTPQMDMGWLDSAIAAKVKLGHFLELSTELSGPWNVDVEVYWDGRLHQTLYYSLGNTHALPVGQVVSLQQRLLGSGRRLQLRLTQAEGGHDFKVFRCYLGCTVLDNRQSEVYWDAIAPPHPVPTRARWRF